MSAEGAADLELRRATSDDDEQVLELLTASLGWVPDDQYGAFFRWKHRENPFGQSPAWVAVDGERIAGLRIFLRWEFTQAGVVQRAVRAVDTATHPDHQGRGIFTRLTMHALEELRADGVDFVYNTPNAQSLPGYLKMGWHEVGRQRIAVRPRLRPTSIARLAQARTPAEKWSERCTIGLTPAEAFADAAAVDALLDSQPADAGLRTRRTPEFLRWRYGLDSLAYRVVLDGDDVSDGFAVLRLRRRGPAVEAAVVEVVVPAADPARRAGLLRATARRARADYAVVVAAQPPWRAGFVPFPGQGPLLTWRAVNRTDPPPAHDWQLSLGDIELF